MPKKREARRDSGATKPKQLRKRLRKAEDQLEAARMKRDRAQARVEALSIIADEIRAQIAELQKTKEASPDVSAGKGPTSKSAPTARVSAAKRSTTGAATSKSPAGKPAAKPARASTTPGVTAGKDPAAEERQPAAGEAAG